MKIYYKLMRIMYNIDNLYHYKREIKDYSLEDLEYALDFYSYLEIEKVNLLKNAIKTKNRKQKLLKLSKVCS